MEEEYEVLEGKKLIKPDFKIKGNYLLIPTEDLVVKQIVRLGRFYSLEAGATLAIIYITASRISEVVRYDYTGIAQKELHITKRPFCFGDVVPIERRNPSNKKELITWIHFPTRVQKNFFPKKDMTLEEREKMLKIDKMKMIMIPYIETHPLFPLLELIDKYMESVVGKQEDLIKYKDMPFWQHSKSHLQKICKKQLGINVHLFRHWRTKHLVENYGYHVSDLMHTIKWKSASMALHYAESRDEVVEQKQLDAANTLE